MLRFLLLLALGLCGAGAFAQAPDWRSAAPPLPLSAPITPITAPAAIGGAAWGPWRKLCREQWERLDSTPRRDCLDVAAVERDAPARATRISLAPGVLQGERLAVLRRDDGAITSFTHDPPDAARDGALAPWRRHFESWSLTARRIQPNAIFDLPVPDSPRGVTCRPEGLSRIGARQVLVAICAVELAGALGNTGQEARIAMVGRIAIDLPTGMITAQGYASRIETFRGGRSNGVAITAARNWLE
ncbi:MAG: hypothetical protein ING08_10925 [Roseomonas sp.]|nr:hypothetical protein [Roseomonas sp.]MCA3380745.1 hypothetical protein [Roseomonas sp.]